MLVSQGWSELIQLIVKTEGNQWDITNPLPYVCDVNVPTSTKSFPIHFAATTGSCSLVTFLLRNNADINCKNTDSATPLHWACLNRTSNVGMIIKQLIDNNADINAVDDGMYHIPLCIEI
jgi:ankyrin repeat protein